jgi:hypothetical protein
VAGAIASKNANKKDFNKSEIFYDNSEKYRLPEIAGTIPGGNGQGFTEEGPA